jgi:hypothetical protein
MNETALTHGSEVCVQLPDGGFSDAAIHDAIMAGVDDSDIRARTRAKLHAGGVPAEALNRLFPDLPPLPEE